MKKIIYIHIYLHSCIVFQNVVLKILSARNEKKMGNPLHQCIQYCRDMNVYRDACAKKLRKEIEEKC